MTTITVNLAEQEVSLLIKRAQERGTSVDALVADLVRSLEAPEAPLSDDFTTDSLYTMKAHPSPAPSDLAAHADAYLYGEQ